MSVRWKDKSDITTLAAGDKFPITKASDSVDYFTTPAEIKTYTIPEGTEIKSTGEAGGTKYLREDGDGTCSWQTPAGSGDMVLADVQSVTGLKTFDTTKLAVKGSSTGSTAIASANASATDYTATLQAVTGTVALTADVPVKATGAEADTGTDDDKFLTAKAAKDSHNIPSVAPGTSGNVLTSNGTDWTSATPASSGGATKSIRYVQLSGVTPNGTYSFSTADISGTIANVRWTSSILPVGSARTLDIRKNGTASTDSIFTSDTPISKATNESATNGKYTTEGAVIDNGTLAENDVLYFVLAGGSTSGTADDFISIEIS